MHNTQKIHFIAIGGSVMHHLAIALKKQGHQVSGSDDVFFDPSRTNLQKHGLLPEKEGWQPERITSDLDAVILGMHAKADNPELKKAQELGLKIYSFPEYIYEQSRNKQRIVIAGSHGKTSITSIILHVLKTLNKKFDYLVGAELEGFDGMVQLSDAPIIVIEGDEYTTSPLDKTPKFLHYHHHIGLISGIAWDHINVFPTEEEYMHQFELFADATPKGGVLIYNEEDLLDSIIGNKQREDVIQIAYKTPKYKVEDGRFVLKTKHDGKIPLHIFGEHNMQNLSGALELCRRIGVTDSEFYQAISSFKGAAKRLQLLKETNGSQVFRDFAHAPSKLKASVNALKEQNPKRKLIAVLELHTYSSLNKDFLPNYAGTFKKADVPVVFYNPEAVALKRLEEITADDIRAAFQMPKLNVFSDAEELRQFLLAQETSNSTIAFMSSANMGNLNLNELADELLA